MDTTIDASVRVLKLIRRSYLFVFSLQNAQESIVRKPDDTTFSVTFTHTKTKQLSGSYRVFGFKN